MSSYFQDIIALLLEPPGNLVYHLVLAFSLAGALAIALHNWRETGSSQNKRMVFGLGLVLLLRLVLFVAAGLAWQGVINGSLLLPPIDRAVNLMSLVLVVWMWVFPQPSRMGDTATFLMSLLVLTLFIFSLVWWSSQITQSDFIGSWPDTASVMLSIAISTAGALLLVLNRSAGWGFGLGMLFIFLVGDVAYLTYPYPEGDFAGAVRLAQMVAFPMLLMLPLRFSATLVADQHEFQDNLVEHATTLQPVVQPDLYSSLLSLVEETDPERLYQAVVRLIAQKWLADLCLLVSPPGVHGKIEILSGFDLIQETPLGKSILNSQSIPVIATALRRGRPLRLPANSTSPDLARLGKLLEIKSTGHLLSVPVMDEAANLLAGLILLTPYTKRGWTSDDQFRLVDAARPLTHVLQHTQMLASLNGELEQVRAELKGAQEDADQIRRENELLVSQLGINPDGESDQKVHAASLAALLVAHEAAQETIEKLKAENSRLQHDVTGHVEQIRAVPEGEVALDPVVEISESQAEAELRLALEEVAYLKSLIYESDRKLLEIKEEVAMNAPAPSQMQDILARVQDLRQPMSSIVGYTDFLLGESIGILGNLQRRFLERIRTSAVRMTAMLDNLSWVQESAGILPESSIDDIDLLSLIDNALSSTRDQMRERNIALRMDLPKQIPGLNNSKASLQKLIEALLARASNASPVNGEVTLLVRLEGENGAKDFVLIQVIDQGDAIAPQVIPAVNSAGSSVKVSASNGLGDSQENLLYLRSLAESLGGRVWVDSSPIGGSIFSLLFPISISSENNNNGAGRIE